MPIRVKRVYEPPLPGDGYRVLVERLWPRGMARERVRADRWIRDAGASRELRVWYAHDPLRWEEFRRRYDGEMRTRPIVIRELEDILAAHPVVTFLFSARDGERNNAVALREFLETAGGKRVASPAGGGHGSVRSRSIRSGTGGGRTRTSRRQRAR